MSLRNFYVEAGGPADSREMFQRVYTGEGLWQRRGGQAKQPLIAAFPEVRASRLRLVVTDFRNPPLAIRSVRFSARLARLYLCHPPRAMRSCGCSSATRMQWPPTMTLPAIFRLNCRHRPIRAALGAVEPNPDFVPPPKPLTERWPWLIYVVLGAASIVLGLVILSLARSAIAMHDRDHPPHAADAGTAPATEVD